MCSFIHTVGDEVGLEMRQTTLPSVWLFTTPLSPMQMLFLCAQNYDGCGNTRSLPSVYHALLMYLPNSNNCEMYNNNRHWFAKNS